MFWALMAWYFFGGAGAGGATVLTSSGVDRLREQVEIVVEDNARRQSASATLKRLKKDVSDFEKLYAKSGDRLNKLYRQHDGDRERALAILDNLNAEWTAGQARALDARFALRETLTEEEWSELFRNDD